MDKDLGENVKPANFVLFKLLLTHVPIYDRIVDLR